MLFSEATGGRGSRIFAARPPLEASLGADWSERPGTPLLPPIFASKYSVFIALRNTLPRKDVKRHIVASKDQTTNGLEAGTGFRGSGSVEARSPAH
jgi:hypothetical protein